MHVQHMENGLKTQQSLTEIQRKINKQQGNKNNVITIFG